MSYSAAQAWLLAEQSSASASARETAYDCALNRVRTYSHTFTSICTHTYLNSWIGPLHGGQGAEGKVHTIHMVLGKDSHSDLRLHVCVYVCVKAAWQEVPAPKI